MTYNLFIKNDLINFEFDNKIRDMLINGLCNVEKHYNREVKNINYIFCSDDYLLGLNTKYLHHNAYTDIITFELAKYPIEGEIYISPERVKENARKYKIEFLNELKRVMAHGFLHLVGYNDKSAEEKKTMKEQEDSCILLFL